MRRVLGFWIPYIRISIALRDGRLDVFDTYYKNESRLASNDIAIIASYIYERTPKENRILCLWDYFLIDSDFESSSIPLCDCR